jgi:hypothetical protein
MFDDPLRIRLPFLADPIEMGSSETLPLYVKLPVVILLTAASWAAVYFVASLIF